MIFIPVVSFVTELSGVTATTVFQIVSPDSSWPAALPFSFNFSLYDAFCESASSDVVSLSLSSLSSIVVSSLSMLLLFVRFFISSQTNSLVFCLSMRC